MKRLLVVFISSIICDLAQAEDTWFCSEDASRLNSNGDELSTCGDGRGQDKDEASKMAFHEAHMEFWRVCQASDTCKGYEVSIIPNRAECIENKKIYSKDYPYPKYRLWTCRRMLTFIINRRKPKCDENGRDIYRGCPMNRMPFDGV